MLSLSGLRRSSFKFPALAVLKPIFSWAKRQFLTSTFLGKDPTTSFFWIHQNQTYALSMSKTRVFKMLNGLHREQISELKCAQENSNTRAPQE